MGNGESIPEPWVQWVRVRDSRIWLKPLADALLPSSEKIAASRLKTANIALIYGQVAFEALLDQVKRRT